MRVLVVGAARTGLAVTRYCARRGDEVTLTDRRTELHVDDGLPAGVRLELGAHRLASFTGAELIVVSPGVPEIPELAAARRAGVPVIGEIELAACAVDAPIVAITGTNGKSTTTALCGAIAAETGRPTFCGGNLGTPFIEAAGTPAGAAGGLCVVEISSFQLETCETFRPRVAMLLNITADHLDRYPSMAEYVAAKARIFARQTPDDFAIVNAADPLAVDCAARGRAKVLRFAADGRSDVDAFVDGDSLVLRVHGQIERYPRGELKLIGRHNAENALAAYLGARLVGATLEQVRSAARAFPALPHRMELVGEGRGVRYYDDSKGTNVGAVVASLTGFPQPFVLIAGGKHKGGEYGPLRPVLAGRCRALVVIGEAAPLLEAALGDVTPTQRAATLEEAVRRAALAAHEGDAVVLSPACSSFDMFRDYEHRAEVFRTAVREVVR
jgi:UDP-N-acetylmuramoylalanine--D-glutamate ligase